MIAKKLSKKLDSELQKQKDLIDSYIKEPTEIELHDIRVSIRKVRSIFMLSYDFYELQVPKYPKKRYKEIFDKSSEVRDIDTFLLFLEDKDEDKLKTILNEKRELLLKELNYKLESINEDSELKNGVKTLQENLEKISKKGVDSYLNDLYNSLLFEFGNLFKQNDLDLEHLHEMRKKCKKIRYKLEAVQNVKHKSKIKLCKNIQDRLGVINDYRVWMLQLENFHMDKSKLFSKLKKLQKKEIASFKTFLSKTQTRF